MATSSPVLVTVWNMMSGQASRGRWEERETSTTASSLARPEGREAREEALQQVKVRVRKKVICHLLDMKISMFLQGLAGSKVSMFQFLEMCNRKMLT